MVDLVYRFRDWKIPLLDRPPHDQGPSFVLLRRDDTLKNNE